MTTVDGDLQQPIGILEPKRLTGRHLTEGPGADKGYASRGNAGVRPNRTGTQAADGIAVAVDVDDFCQFVGPVEPARRLGR